MKLPNPLQVPLQLQLRFFFRAKQSFSTPCQLHLVNRDLQLGNARQWSIPTVMRSSPSLPRSGSKFNRALERHQQLREESQYPEDRLQVQQARQEQLQQCGLEA